MLDQTNIRTDFDAIPDGATIILHPREANPLHRAPVEATHSIGFFYCNGSDPTDGPDYWIGDVRMFCDGWSFVGGGEE